MGQFVWKLNSIQLSVPGNKVEKLGDKIAFLVFILFYLLVAFKHVCHYKRLLSVLTPGAKVPYFLSLLHSSTAAWVWWDNAPQAVIKWWQWQRPSFSCLTLSSPESDALWLGDRRKRNVCKQPAARLHLSHASSSHNPRSHGWVTVGCRGRRGGNTWISLSDMLSEVSDRKQH